MEGLSAEFLIFLSILLNVILSIIFKLYKTYDVDVLSAIIVNYGVCFLTAWVTLGEIPLEQNLTEQKWFYYAIGLAACFILVFNLNAITTQKLGIAKTVVYQKMSMIAPVVLGLLIFSEVFDIWKGAGILCSILAILLLSGISYGKSNQNIRTGAEIFGVLTFLGNCCIDGALYVFGELDIVDNANIKFVAHLFVFAGCFGILFTLFKYFTGRPFKFGRKELIGGIALGVPNFFTIYFILKVLDMGWDGSSFFPINNVGILALGGIVGVFLFGEKLSFINKVGLGFAILTIYLLA